MPDFKVDWGGSRAEVCVQPMYMQKFKVPLGLCVF